jgi:hypothetical protein
LKLESEKLNFEWTSFKVYEDFISEILEIGEFDSIAFWVVEDWDKERCWTSGEWEEEGTNEGERFVFAWNL